MDARDVYEIEVNFEIFWISGTTWSDIKYFKDQGILKYMFIIVFHLRYTFIYRSSWSMRKNFYVSSCLG